MTSILLDPAYKGKPEFPKARIHGSSTTQLANDQLSYRGNWPRMINLSEKTEERLKRWLDYEIDGFHLERGNILDQWKKHQSLYWAEPETEERNFPFRKAANIVIPLAAIAVEAIHARLMNTLFSVEPFYSIRPKSKDWIQSAKPFENYLQTEVENGETLKMFSFCQESLLELTKLGTCVAKTGYERLTKKSLRTFLGEKKEEPFFVTVRNGATVGRVPLSNFILRLNETDPQTAPLVGERHEISWSQLKSYAQDGRMNEKVIERIKHHWADAQAQRNAGDGAELQQKVSELANAEPAWTETFVFYEIWCLFDVDGDGWDEEIVVDFHKESGEFLSIRYNWYDDLHRPYHVCQFLKVEGVWPGIGVCKQVEQFQEEATTIHRQRLDNATLANMKMIALKKDSDYGPGEPVFPGKQWFLDDPSKDIKEISLSEIYPSSYANEEQIVRYYEKRSGANEVILGLPHEGTPATATSDLTRLAEGNKRFDLVLKNVKRFLSNIGVDIITNMQIFGNQEVHWMVMGQEEGAWVEKVLRMPSILVRRGAVVNLTVSDSVTNREVEQRQWMSLFQIITGYYNQVLQLAQLLGPEVFGGIAQKALITSDEAMRRLLETFAIPDSDRFSLVEENANGTQPGQAPGNGQPANGTANNLAGTTGELGPTRLNGPSIQERVGNLPAVNGNGAF